MKDYVLRQINKKVTYEIQTILEFFQEFFKLNIGSIVVENTQERNRR